MTVSHQVWESWSAHLAHCWDSPSFSSIPQVVVQQRSPEHVAVEVRIPMASLAGAAKNILTRDGRYMVMRGFRPGHAPTRLLLPQLKSWLLVQTLRELIEPSWDTNAAELPGQLVENSELHLDVSVEGGVECLAVVCECEVLPRLELPPSYSSQVGPHVANLPTEMWPTMAHRLSVYAPNSTPTNEGDLPLPQAAEESNPVPDERRRGDTDFESLCWMTSVAVPSSLLNLLTAGFARVAADSVNPESLRNILKYKLHQAQVAHAVAGEAAAEEEDVNLAGEVEDRAAALGISAASFRARYLADEEQRELFTARIRQEQRLRRLGSTEAELKGGRL